MSRLVSRVGKVINLINVEGAQLFLELPFIPLFPSNSESDWKCNQMDDGGRLGRNYAIESQSKNARTI